MATPRTLRLNASDNVVVAVDEVPAGAAADGVVARARIPKGHKMAISAIGAEKAILKFGQVIGFASTPIAPGEWVHEHNCAMRTFARDHRFGEAPAPLSIASVADQPTFDGFRRANGKVGTRNYLALLTSVNCSATTARLIAREVERSGVLADYPNVDGVIALVHGTGCGMASKGEGFETFMRTEWGYAANPNVGATLMIGLGCEVFQISRMKEEYGARRGRRVSEPDHPGDRRHAQDGGGGSGAGAVDAAPARPRPPRADPGERADAGAAVRRVGRLFRHHREPGARGGGGHPRTQRGDRDPVGDPGDLRRRAPLDPESRQSGGRPETPRPHPLVGGLLRPQRRRDEQQSFAGQQGGRPRRPFWRSRSAPRRRAAPRRSSPSTNTPSRSRRRALCSWTRPDTTPCPPPGQVAGGANVLAFTTGRGSAFGCKPTPSIKLATNSDVYRRMIEDMDINCGDVLDGVSIADKGREIFERVLAVASGERTKSEALGYGEAEFAPWQIGATM